MRVFLWVLSIGKDAPGERCRADALLIGVKPAHERDFFANMGPAASISQLDRAERVMAVGVTGSAGQRSGTKRGSKSHTCW
jgi:hypothetical protein